MLKEYDIEGVVNEAFDEWIEANSEKKSEKRMIVILPIDETILKTVKSAAHLTGSTVTRVAEEAIEGWLNRRLAGGPTTREPDVAAIPTSSTADTPSSQTLECSQCHYSWESRVARPVACPRCQSRKWDAAGGESPEARIRDGWPSILRCWQCDHRWKPRSGLPPAACPKCQSREWEKVVMCGNAAEGQCEKQATRAPLDTGAGKRGYCESCWRGMYPE